MLASAPGVSRAIGSALKGKRPPDEIAALAYRQLWNPTKRLQREFQVRCELIYFSTF